MRQRRVVVSHIVAILVVTGLNCATSEQPDLHQAVATINWQLAEYNLARSMFAVVLPNGTPKQWVRYYFSTMGAAEHAPGEEHATEEEREMAGALRTPLWPKDVSAVHTKPNPSLGKQVVLKWDDARDIVIVEAYLNPADSPAFVREIPLPKVKSANELARITAQSHLEMGSSFQAF